MKKTPESFLLFFLFFFTANTNDNNYYGGIFLFGGTHKLNVKTLTLNTAPETKAEVRSSASNLC